MLDEQVFRRYFGALQSRHPSLSLDQIVIAHYYGALSAVLNNQQFVQAVGLSLQRDRFFPTVQDLIDSVVLSADDRALLDWERIIHRLKGEKTVEALSGEGSRALALLGGMTTLGELSSQQLNYLKKEFVEAYKFAHRDALHQERLKMQAQMQQELAQGQPQAQLEGASTSVAAVDWANHPFAAEWLQELESIGVEAFAINSDRAAFARYCVKQQLLEEVLPCKR